MFVADIMTTDVATCLESDSLDQAARIMWERDCGIVPVLSETGRVIGVITDRDAVMAAHFEGKTLSEIPVGRVMSRSVHACDPGDSLEAAEDRMQSAQVRRLPVINMTEQMVGILSLNDIARASDPQDGTDEVPIVLVGQTLASIGRPREKSPAS
jgi:CBS domain-containing protein